MKVFFKEIELTRFGKHTVRIANTSTPAECNTEGFSQTACGFVVEFEDIITIHVMNSDYKFVGGWEASDMRSYVNSDIYNAFPSDLKGLIINTKVVSGHEDGVESNYVTTDKLYLLATAEIWENGTSDTITYDTARDLTRQLDYYEGVTTNNYSKAIKTSDGSNDYWWLRSAYFEHANTFCYVTDIGNWDYDGAGGEFGVSAAFRIG